jgi:hypothetical protein
MVTTRKQCLNLPGLSCLHLGPEYSHLRPHPRITCRRTTYCVHRTYNIARSTARRITTATTSAPIAGPTQFQPMHVPSIPAPGSAVTRQFITSTIASLQGPKLQCQGTCKSSDHCPTATIRLDKVARVGRKNGEWKMMETTSRFALMTKRSRAAERDLARSDGMPPLRCPVQLYQTGPRQRREWSKHVPKVALSRDASLAASPAVSSLGTFRQMILALEGSRKRLM